MDWVAIIFLIAFGLSLVVAEIIFVPGTTIIGILGLIVLIFGIGLSFRYFGNQTGMVVLVSSLCSLGVVLYFCFKSKAWATFSLKDTIDSKVNEGRGKGLKEAMEGKTTSALRPIGTAQLQDKIYEVKTFGEYIDSGTRVRIVKLLVNQIIVEKIN